MAVPTITVVSPSPISTGGAVLLQVMGGGFQLPAAPPISGPAPTPPPTVEVVFGSGATSRLGTRAAVASDARLFVLAPASPLGHTAPAGAVDVTVRNIDANGVLIPGETVTATGALTYAVPDINTSPEYDLTRLSRTLIRELGRQVLPGGVHLTVHTDYADDPTSGLAALAEIPALVLSGPNLRENRFYSLNGARYVDTPFGLSEDFAGELPVPYTVDLVWDIVGVTDNKIQNVNLMAEVVRFFHRNKRLFMDNDPNDPTAGEGCWEMDWEPLGLPKTVGTPNASNIRAFKGIFAIRGFDIDEAVPQQQIVRALEDQIVAGSVVEPSALILGGPVDTEEPANNTPGVAAEQIGQSFGTGPPPGD